MKDSALIIFQKNPIPGKVKTRLAKDVGDEVALDVYQLLVAKTHQEAFKSQADVWLFYSDFIPEDQIECSDYPRIQSGGDLGERMKNAFEEVFKQGYRSALIIGTDCPEISVEILDQALLGLQSSDLVIGPAKDGGYYLLGMRKFSPELFEQISWSTDAVLQQTKTVAQKNDLSIHFLPEFSDIDTLEDLNLLISQKPEYEYLLRNSR